MSSDRLHTDDLVQNDADQPVARDDAGADTGQDALEPLFRSDRSEELHARWQELQARFVDDPSRSVAKADSLIQNVMRDRGYPVDDFDTRAADLSVDHPDVVENYRAGHGIAVAHERGKATTEELRKAVQHYRALFDELVEARQTEEARA